MKKLINPETTTSGQWSGRWVIYDDDIKTGGGISLLATLDGQTLNFESKEDPYEGSKCIKYSWNGSTVTSYSDGKEERDFVGFKLVVSKSDNETNTKDLTKGGYTKLTFWAKGSLNANVCLRVEANSDDANFYKINSGKGVWMGQITNIWQKYEIQLDEKINNLKAVKDYIRIIMRYNEDADPVSPNIRPENSNGGTVFIDDIEFNR